MADLQNKEKEDPWGCYYEGYSDMIHATLTHYQSCNKQYNQNVLYALLFNVRHMIELGLKDILAQFKYIEHVGDVRCDHDIQDLIKHAEEKLKSYPGFKSDSWTTKWETIKAQANFFVKHDRRSYTFRYPAEKKPCTPSISSELQMDLDKVAGMYNQIKSSFLGITPQLMADKDNDLRYFDA